MDLSQAKAFEIKWRLQLATYKRIVPVNRIMVGTALLGVFVLLTGCGNPLAVHITGPASSAAAEPGVSTYLCSGGTDSDLLQWRENSGDLSGTYQSVQVSGQALSEEVSSNSGGLSGTLDGTAITLSIGLSQPLYGSLSDGQLSLNVPQSNGTIQTATCRQASIADWNKEVAALSSQVNADNQQANQAEAQASHDQDASQAQQSLAHDVASLEGDSETLNNDNSLATDISQMKTDYATEQSDYQTERSDSCDSMGVDADGVGTDADGVGTDLDGLQTDVSGLKSGDIQAVQDDLSSVARDLSALHGLGVSPDMDSSSAIDAGNKALSSAANAIKWANGQGNTIDSEAQQLGTTAQSYANSRCG